MNEKLELAAAMLQWLDAMATWDGLGWRIIFDGGGVFERYDSFEEIVEDLTTVPNIQVGDVVISRINAGRGSYEVLDIDHDLLAQLCPAKGREKMIGGRIVVVREPYEEWIPLVFLRRSEQ